MKWLVALLLVVLRDPHVQRAFRALVLAVGVALASALGLSGALHLVQQPSELLFSPPPPQ